MNINEAVQSAMKEVAPDRNNALGANLLVVIASYQESKTGNDNGRYKRISRFLESITDEFILESMRGE